MSKEDIFEAARESVIQADESMAMQALEDAKAEKINPLELLSKGYSEGIRQMGDLFESGEIFIPELLMSAGIMKKVTEVIESSLDKKEMANKATLVIGTVAGDVHDIGKAIVSSIVRSNGIEVIDLGREVPAQTFVDKAKEYNADFIGSSALLTTTMKGQKEIEDILRKEGIRDKYKTLVGGAPVTKRWAEKIGADAYCEDASETVEVLLKWIKEKTV